MTKPTPDLGAEGGRSRTSTQVAAITSIDRRKKVAAVLLAVGPDRAARVLESFDEEEIEQVTAEIANLEELPGAKVEAILTELREEFLASEHLHRGSAQQARQILHRLYGSRADDVFDRLMANAEPGPFQFLEVHDPEEVLQHFRDEHPQTMALVLAHLPPWLGAQVLAGLEREIQVDVSMRLAGLERADPDIVETVESGLRRRLGDARRSGRRRDGARDLADVLNQSDRSTERSILGSLEETHPQLAEQVRSLMFLFEDVATLNARSLQELLRHVDGQLLALALKNAPDELRTVFERNLSERARTIVQEEADLLGQVRVRDVEQAQSEIVRLVHELEATGVITIDRGDEFVA